MDTPDWKPTACVLCSENCGLEVQLDGRRIARIKGDRRHPTSAGYLCDKASHLDHYQNHPDRLTTPLRRTASGAFEPISWDTAINDVAARIRAIRDGVGPHALAFYGGAGQGNHLALPWAVGFRFAMRTPYMYHALGQEKTGEFWLDGHLYGSQTCHTGRDIEHSDFVMFSGTNPWHAHGFPRARKVLKEISADPNRMMVVVDPRKTETAALADIHLQLRPGTDAFLFAGLLGTIVQEGLENRDFLARRTTGFETIRAALATVDIDRYAQIADVDPALVRRVARGFAGARSACVRSDLGLQQSLHSTLNLYLEKLLYLITGQFGKRGGVGIHTQTIPLIWHNDPSEPGFNALRTRVNGMIPIGGFYPPNLLPSEIDSDHPDRVRGLFVDSANPAVTGADTQACRRALDRLELLVVIDKDLTETAERAHYVLPACSQFERFDCTFFNWGYPENHLHLRHPLLPPTEGTLAEQEIYLRLAQALGEDFSKNPLLGPMSQIMQSPPFQQMPAPMRAATAPLMMASMMYVQKHEAAVRRAGVNDEGDGLAAALFRRIVSSPSGATISLHEYADSFSFITHQDSRIHLGVEPMLVELTALEAEAASGGTADPAYPFMLCAGERRSSNATTNYRHPSWRSIDTAGVLRVHRADADAMAIRDGDAVICESRRGRITATALVDDTVRPGVVSLPHGFGLKYTAEDGTRVQHGPLINLLSSSDHCDALAKTPFHKNIPVRLRKADAPDAEGQPSVR
jgi:anaerobic selenocysteine-containing dehydrogenase